MEHSPPEGRLSPFRVAQTVLFLILVSMGLYLIYRRDHLLYLLVAEVFCVVVAAGIFMITWNARRIMDNHYLSFLGVAYVFVVGIDLLHALAYQGAALFGVAGPDLPAQLWTAARALQAVALLAAPFFVRRRLRPYIVFPACFVVSLLVLAAIFYWKFPQCYVPEKGPTLFTWISSMVITVVFLAAAALLFRRREDFAIEVYQSLLVAVILMAAGEMAFAFSMRGPKPYDFLGHQFKLLAFYMTYKAIIYGGVVRPGNLLFNSLQQSAKALRRERDYVENLLRTAQIIILVRDMEGRVLRFNPYMAELSGHTLAETEGQDWFEVFVPAADREAERAQFLDQTASDESHTRSAQIVTRDGDILDVEWFDKSLTDGDGATVGLLSIGQDVTERKIVEQDMRRMAYHDRLTGLPNRGLFVDRLESAIRQARRSGRRFALMILDLDHFKIVNDTLGHDAGDDLLGAASARLSDAVRASDTVARFGGDEFVLLFPEIAAPDTAEVVARKVFEVFGSPFQCGDRLLDVSASVGVAVYPEDADSAELLHKRADIAMYEVKRHGRNGFRRFTPSLLAET